VQIGSFSKYSGVDGKIIIK